MSAGGDMWRIGFVFWMIASSTLAVAPTVDPFAFYGVTLPVSVEMWQEGCRTSPASRIPILRSPMSCATLKARARRRCLPVSTARSKREVQRCGGLRELCGLGLRHAKGR